MAKQIVEDAVWHDRILEANKYYDVWDKFFKCTILEEYYEGTQWKSQDQLGFAPYVINKVYETVQIKLAQYVPTFPKYLINARPGNSEYDIEGAARSANLKQDIINTIINDGRVHFSEELEQAYKDSFFRFGMMEVGYSADWIENPNAPKPALGKDVETQLSQKMKQKVRIEPKELPIHERVYIKHIPAKRFRVGGIDNKYLNHCSWVGYYDFIYRDDLMSLKIMNRDKIFENAIQDQRIYTASGDEKHKILPGVIKVWKIWDMLTMQRLMILDSPTLTVFQRKFSRLPLFDYRPDRRLIVDGFYPIPPVFHWLSPQNEINEIREQLRAHRRRFVRKFQVREGAIDDLELEKFESGPDGALIKVARENAIIPIQNADLGASVNISLETSADDLNRISGTSNEMRGVADRTTATQANIINNRSGIRENKERDRVVNWLIGVGRETLLVVRDNFTLGIWINLTSGEGEQFLGSVQTQNQAYKWVTSEDLNDGYDFRIDIDVTSLSTAAQEEEKKKFLEFLAILTQYPQISFSPILVREAAVRVGYRNEKAIQEMQKMALLMEHARMAQLGMPEPGNMGQQQVAQQTPNTMEQIRNQLGNQQVVQ